VGKALINVLGHPEITQAIGAEVREAS
jgi:hypothetical protein